VVENAPARAACGTANSTGESKNTQRTVSSSAVNDKPNARLEAVPMRAEERLVGNGMFNLRLARPTVSKTLGAWVNGSLPR
ncbi:MAG: hypothetical protein RLZZ366_974, partial [Pseudomonadota bacterium]